MNIEALKNFKVTHVICCAPGLAKIWPKFKQYPDIFNYLNLSLEDSHDQELLPSLRTAIEFTENADNKSFKFFIHCAQGVSRSGAILAGILMKRENITYDEALIKIKRGRACVQPNKYFESQLRTINL